MKKVFLSSLALFCAVLPASEEIAIRFEDIAQKSGLLFTSDSSPTPNKNQPETMVGGVALVDYDNDGYLDVYFVNGAGIPSLKKESPKYWNRLYHNNRNGTFTDVTEKAGVMGEGYGMGVAIGDYDADRIVCTATITTALSPTSPTRHICPAACWKAGRCGPSRPDGSISTTMAIWTSSSPITASGK